MKKIVKILAVAVPATLAFAAPAYIVTSVTPAVAADAATAQDSVKKGLRIFNQVVAHTGRLVAAKSYENVGHEHEEVIEGAEILREGLAGGAADLKAKAEPAIVKAVAASTALKDISATKDATKTEAAHAAYAAAVKELIALFPADMHPPAAK